MKRTLGMLVLLAAVTLLASTSVYADSVVIASLGTVADAGQTNSSGNPTIAIDPNSAWSQALGTSSWVSFTTSGNTSASSYVQVANGTKTSFFDTFTLSGTPTTGYVDVMADDSTSVWLNGHQLVFEAPTTNNNYVTCSDFGIGCRGAIRVDLTDYLQTGSNTLQFEVAQRAGWSYGLDYYGVIDPTSVPEPASILFLGTGLSALALRLRRRNK